MAPDNDNNAKTDNVVEPNFKEGPTKGKGAAKKATGKKKAAAKKASTTDRAKSVVSKEGTKKDAFTGEELPVTAFPTKKNPETGVYDLRGDVARKNLEAYRADRKAKREKAKAEKAATKAATKAKKARKSSGSTAPAKDDDE